MYSNGKMVRISEAGILAFGKSDAMKRRSPRGAKVLTSSKRSRFVCERTAVTKEVSGMDGSIVSRSQPLTFDDDDLTVDDGNSERAVLHHPYFLCGGMVTRDVTEEESSRLRNTLGRTKRFCCKRDSGL